RDLLALPAGQRPTALFSANNRNTVGALRALSDAPTPVALVGFDDFELADMLAVPITVVRHDPGAMGRIGAELAYARLDGGAAPRRRGTWVAGVAPRGPGGGPARGPRPPRSSPRQPRSATSIGAARRSRSCAASTSSPTTRPRSGSARRRRCSVRARRGSAAC